MPKILVCGWRLYYVCCPGINLLGAGVGEGGGRGGGQGRQVLGEGNQCCASFGASVSLTNNGTKVQVKNGPKRCLRQYALTEMHDK